MESGGILLNFSKKYNNCVFILSGAKRWARAQVKYYAGLTSL